MKEEVHAPGCGRENDLIAFLYGELDPGERTAFRSHMQECSSCSVELAEFTNIRESLVAWRDEALVGFAVPAVQALPVVSADVIKPSALVALREFFNLSPLWMKGAVVFASVLFCLFAVLAAARLRETPAANPSAKMNVISNQELNEIVEQRVQDEVNKRMMKSPEPSPAPLVMANDRSDRVAPRKNTIRTNDVALRRPLSKVERQELAADLRLIANPTEGELDLLDDRINQ